MNEYNKVREAYKEIFMALNKHGDTTIFDIESLKNKADLHLFGVKLKEVHGLNLNPKYIYSTEYCRICDYRTITNFRDGDSKSMGWSDNGEQPKDELLLELRFSTGAYMFGDDYPNELFQKFFLELKTYSPKYTDSHNHALFFSIDNAAAVFNEFDSIIKRYNEQYKEESKARRIEKLKAEIEKLSV